MFIPLLMIFLALIPTTHQVTNKFGLLTVTHSRDGDYSVLEKYLKKYAETECYTELISEINLVWNNEVAPQSTAIYKRKQYWKIPVYFYRTTFNSMDHRYRLPKESNAQLLYSLDDDIIVDCHTFKITLDEYNRVGNGRLGRIVTNQVRGFKFQPSALQNKQFSYQGHAQALYYTISEPGAAFIPRHYLQMYYLKLDQLLELRNQILDVKNCDDIFFYAFVQHFYPQLPAVYVQGQKDYKNTDPKVGQSKVKNVYPTRSKCITDISNAFGYNPLRYYSKNSQTYLKNWEFGNIKSIIQQKIRGFYEVDYQQPSEKVYQQTVQNQQAKNDELVTPVNPQTKVNEKKGEQIVNKNDKSLQVISKVSEQEIPKVENTNKHLQDLKNYTGEIRAQNKINQFTVPSKKQQKPVYPTMSPRGQLFLYIFLIIVLAIAALLIYKSNCDKRKNYRIQLQQQEDSHQISIDFRNRS